MLFILSTVFCTTAETGKPLSHWDTNLYLSNWDLVGTLFEHLQNTNKNLVYEAYNVLVSAECMGVTDFTPSDIFIW